MPFVSFLITMPVTKHGQHITSYHFDKWLRRKSIETPVEEVVSSVKSEITTIHAYIEKLTEVTNQQQEIISNLRKLRSRTMVGIQGKKNANNEYVFPGDSTTLSFPYPVTMYAVSPIPQSTKFLKSGLEVQQPVHGKGLEMAPTEMLTITGDNPTFFCYFVITTEIF